VNAASTVLAQLASMAGPQSSTLCCRVSHPDGTLPEHFEVAAASGDYRRYLDRNADEKLPDHIVQSLRDACLDRRHVFGDETTDRIHQSGVGLRFPEFRQGNSSLPVKSIATSNRQFDLSHHIYDVVPYGGASQQKP
jgi:hypothetical protein